MRARMTAIIRIARCRHHPSNSLAGFVVPFKKWPHRHWTAAFSLIEVVAVLLILMVLMTIGVSLAHGAGSQSRRAATDLLAGLIEQARTAAIASHSSVILAIAEPGDLAAGDKRCRLGLFKVETWPDSPADPIKGNLMGRWRMLETGVVLMGGSEDGVENPLDSPAIQVSYGGGKPLTATVHAMVFNSRGGLLHPAGSSPVALRVADGNYRGGKITLYQHGKDHVISENRLKIGRVIARPNLMD